MTDTGQANTTIECPECGVIVNRGKQATEHARAHWLSNPNLTINDLKGEARKRYDTLTGGS